MIFLQLLSLLFGLFMIYWTFFIYKKRTIYLTELVFWAITWTVFILIALFPSTTTVLIQTLRINRTMDFVMILAFIVLWVVAFQNYINNKKLTKKFHDFVRSQAISETLNRKKQRR